MQSLIGMCKVQTCLALAPNIKPYIILYWLIRLLVCKMGLCTWNYMCTGDEDGISLELV